MYAVTFVGAVNRTLVLRCYVRPELNKEEPDLAQREAAALEVAAQTDVATLDLVAVDPAGDVAGVPALLMTWLPGNVVWDPKAPMRWLARLSDVLPSIHQADASAPGLGRYFNYAQDDYTPPPWSSNPTLWERAVEIFHGPILEDIRCFVHRDYHPGNVLWRRGQVTGVVDWQSACVGPPSIDIAHCRANLLGYAPELADAYTDMTEESTGRPFHPWADIASLIGMLDGLRATPPRPSGRQAIEAAITKAVSACQ
jgi:aminoglycoside phosphotransferase (APT) family kinase protein